MWKTAAAVIAISLAGCVAIPGKMYSLKDGTELTFEIQRSYGTGDMSAQNEDG